MINNLLSRLNLVYSKGKEIVKLKEERLLNARAFSICAIGLGSSILENPDSRKAVEDNFTRVYGGYRENNKKITEKITENYSFPKNYFEKLIFRLGYSIA